MKDLRQLAKDLGQDKTYLHAVCVRLSLEIDVHHGRNAMWECALAIADADADILRAYLAEIATNRARLQDA